MIDTNELAAVADLNSSEAAKSNTSVIAAAVGGAMMLVGVGVGFLFGRKSGRKVSAEELEAQKKQGVILEAMVADFKKKLDDTAEEASKTL